MSVFSWKGLLGKDQLGSSNTLERNAIDSNGHALNGHHVVTSDINGGKKGSSNSNINSPSRRRAASISPSSSQAIGLHTTPAQAFPGNGTSGPYPQFSGLARSSTWNAQSSNGFPAASSSNGSGGDAASRPALQIQSQSPLTSSAAQMQPPPLGAAPLHLLERIPPHATLLFLAAKIPAGSSSGGSGLGMGIGGLGSVAGIGSGTGAGASTGAGVGADNGSSVSGVASASSSVTAGAGWDLYKPPPITSSLLGIENFGNTCYANSVLQSLYGCKPFRDSVARYHEEEEDEEPPLEQKLGLESGALFQPYTMQGQGIGLGLEHARRASSSSTTTSSHAHVHHDMSLSPSSSRLMVKTAGLGPSIPRLRPADPTSAHVRSLAPSGVVTPDLADSLHLEGKPAAQGATAAALGLHAAATSPVAGPFADSSSHSSPGTASELGSLPPSEGQSPNAKGEAERSGRFGGHAPAADAAAAPISPHSHAAAAVAVQQDMLLTALESAGLMDQGRLRESSSSSSLEKRAGKENGQTDGDEQWQDGEPSALPSSSWRLSREASTNKADLPWRRKRATSADAPDGSSAQVADALSFSSLSKAKARPSSSASAATATATAAPSLNALKGQLAGPSATLPASATSGGKDGTTAAAVTSSTLPQTQVPETLFEGLRDLFEHMSLASSSTVAHERSAMPGSGSFAGGSDPPAPAETAATSTGSGLGKGKSSGGAGGGKLLLPSGRGGAGASHSVAAMQVAAAQSGSGASAGGMSSAWPSGSSGATSSGGSAPASTGSGSGSGTATPMGAGPSTLNSVPGASAGLLPLRGTQVVDSAAVKNFLSVLKRENILFDSTMHQDAHEMLNFVLNKVGEDLVELDRKGQRQGRGGCRGRGKSAGNLTKHERAAGAGASAVGKMNVSTVEPGGKTAVHRLFEGVLTNETRCLTCETVTSRDESFLDLSLDIERNSSLTACLRQFSANEMLRSRNKFFCDTCSGLQEAEKGMRIRKLPNVLALHLKRFKYEESIQRYIKLAYRVPFPFELRLFNTSNDADDPDKLYKLFAIVVHIGVGPHHGHYISIVRVGDQWVQFDDQSVSIIEEASISKFYGEMPSIGSAYVLFYQAVDMDLEALGLRKPEEAPQYAQIPQHHIHHFLVNSQEAAGEKESSRNWFGSFKRDRRQASTTSNAPARPATSTLGPPLPSTSTYLRPKSTFGKAQDQDDRSSLSTHNSSISSPLAMSSMTASMESSARRGSSSRTASRERPTLSNASPLRPCAAGTTCGSPTKNDASSGIALDAFAAAASDNAGPFDQHARATSADLTPSSKGSAATKPLDKKAGKWAKRSSLAMPGSSSAANADTPMRKASLVSRLGFGKKS